MIRRVILILSCCALAAWIAFQTIVDLIRYF